MNYLLDTNIVLIYTRKSSLTSNIETQLNLFNPNISLYISVVTLGELESLMLQREYGITKIKYLKQLVDRFTIIDINIQEIITAYGAIDSFIQGKLKHKRANFTVRNMGKNDLWISATASVYDLTQITTDHDFNHLDREFIKLKNIDIEQFKV